jgi:hypothetical protein
MPVRLLPSLVLLRQCFSNCGSRTTGGPRGSLGGLQAVSEEKARQKLCQIMNEKYIHTHPS